MDQDRLPPKDAWLQLRVPEAHLRRYRRAATQEGETLSAWIRKLADRRANEVDRILAAR